jgi:hypothetical protein
MQQAYAHIGSENYFDLLAWAKWILAYLFDCTHSHTSWPQRGRTGLDYVCCLECGRELPYSTRLMSIVSKEEQLIGRP